MKTQPMPPDHRPRRAAPAGVLLYVALVLGSPASPGLSQAAESQDSQVPAAVFSEEVRVRVVNVDVIVTDRSGQPVAGLEPDDFLLRLDGRPVPISNFYSESREPLEARSPGAARDTPGGGARDSSFRPVEAVATGASRRSHVVILVDHTRLRPSNRKRAFAALHGAIENLGADDLVAVVGIEGRLVFYSDFLFDRGAVDRILDDLTHVSADSDIDEFERRQIFGELTRGQSGGLLARTSQADAQMLISRIRAYATEEYARSVSSLRQIETVISTLSGVPGRKTMFYLGEGIPTRPGEGMFIEWRNRFGGDNPQAEIGLRRYDFNTDYTREVGRFDLTQSMRQLAAAANRAGVTLYAIDAEGSHGGEIRSALSEQGSTSETVSVIDENYREPLEGAAKATGGRYLRSSGVLTEQLVELTTNLQTFYSLGFLAPEDWQPGSVHDLEVEVKGRGLVVSHREEVRLPEPDEREAGATIAALLYETVDNPLQIAAFPGNEAIPRQDGTAALAINLEIPIARLDFLPRDGSQAASLTIYVCTRNAEGDAGRVQKIPFHLAIPDDKMELARSDRAHYPLPLVLRQGDRQVAIGVRDNVSGEFSAIRLDIAQLANF